MILLYANSYGVVEWYFENPTQEQIDCYKENQLVSLVSGCVPEKPTDGTYLLKYNTTSGLHYERCIEHKRVRGSFEILNDIDGITTQTSQDTILNLDMAVTTHQSVNVVAEDNVINMDMILSLMQTVQKIATHLGIQ